MGGGGRREERVCVRERERETERQTETERRKKKTIIENKMENIVIAREHVE